MEAATTASRVSFTGIRPANPLVPAVPRLRSRGPICRICHGDEGRLVAPCHCRGTVGKVHRSCLERWLSESGRDYCELCGRQFKTERVPKHGFVRSLLRWLATGLDAKQLIVDIVLLLVLTPLVVVALYLVVRSARNFGEQVDLTSPHATYMLVVSVMSSSMVLASFYSWVAAAVQQHVEDWRRWWRTNYSVRLLEDAGSQESICQSSAPVWSPHSSSAVSALSCRTSDTSLQSAVHNSVSETDIWSAESEVHLSTLSYGSLTSISRARLQE